MSLSKSLTQSLLTTVTHEQCPVIHTLDMTQKEKIQSQLEIGGPGFHRWSARMETTWKLVCPVTQSSAGLQKTCWTLLNKTSMGFTESQKQGSATLLIPVQPSSPEFCFLLTYLSRSCSLSLVDGRRPSHACPLQEFQPQFRDQT